MFVSGKKTKKNFDLPDTAMNEPLLTDEDVQNDFAIKQTIPTKSTYGEQQMYRYHGDTASSSTFNGVGKNGG